MRDAGCSGRRHASLTSAGPHTLDFPFSVEPPINYKAYPILVVDDERAIIETFRLNFDDEFNVLGALDGEQALALVRAEPVAVLVADQRMPRMHGAEVIREALAIRPAILPIVLTGYTDFEALVRAVNVGRIFRYIAKPWDPAELEHALRRAIESAHLARENAHLTIENERLVAELRRANTQLSQEVRYLRRHEAPRTLVATSAAMQQVLARVERVADSTTTVLIHGQTGTGKELIARALHDRSGRSGKPFVAINCGGMTEGLLESELFGYRRGAFTGAVADRKGLFEVAHGGTIFLDEIGDAPPALQVQLLRVLQEREIRPVGTGQSVPVDVRVIAATNRDLDVEVAAGRFRDDLYFRLRVLPILVPALNDRRDDILPLAAHILATLCRDRPRQLPELTAGARTALIRHDYRGNVRELHNLIERALLLSDPGEPLTESHLFDRHPDAPGHAAPGGGSESLYEEVAAFERRRLAEALDACGGNKTQAAKQLGLGYRWFLRKLQRYAID